MVDVVVFRGARLDDVARITVSTLWNKGQKEWEVLVSLG
jgi:hypothetical protein